VHITVVHITFPLLFGEVLVRSAPTTTTFSLIYSFQVLGKVTNGHSLTPPGNCPTYIKELMLRCWQHKIELRFSFEDIIGKLESANVRNSQFANPGYEVVATIQQNNSEIYSATNKPSTTTQQKQYESPILSSYTELLPSNISIGISD
jgi:hypothetical protein